MKKFEINNTNYKSIIPKIKYIYVGYKGLNNGLCLLFKGKMLTLIRPINERQ